MKYIGLVCSVCLLLKTQISVKAAGLKQEFTWSRLSYDIPGMSLPSEELVQSSTIPPPDVTLNTLADDQDYQYKNNIPMGANRWKDKLFITVPRRRVGIPSTLNYVPINSTLRHNVPLIPYPNLQTNTLKVTVSQERLISVYRVAVDPCDRLWMVDTGIIETPGNKTKIGPQRIIIIDLNTDKFIKTYTFKDTDLKNSTVLAMVAVDVTTDTCENAFAYFPDFLGYGLVVYSLKDDDSWRFNHNFFNMEPEGGNFHIGGASFQWKDGIFSGGLSHILDNGYRNYIFHAMAGTHLYSVSTKVLRNKELATRVNHGNDFLIIGNKGAGWQSSASDLHQPSGILFFALVNQDGVGCWNIKLSFSPAYLAVIAKDPRNMVYPADLKIYQDDIILLTNKMPVYVYSKLNYDEVNFSVWMNNIYDAVNGTACDGRR
ncbi:hypothetical protein Trydic_g20354 [Trypoxylus dichotomus]